MHKGTCAVGKVSPHTWQPCQGAKLLATMLLMSVLHGWMAQLLRPGNAFSAASPACVRVAHVHATVQHERLASNPHNHTAATNILASTCRRGVGLQLGVWLQHKCCCCCSAGVLLLLRVSPVNAETLQVF